MATYSFRESFNKDFIESVSELMVVTAASRLLGHTGDCLDLSDIDINFSILNSNQMAFFKGSVYSGCLVYPVEHLYTKPESTYDLPAESFLYPDRYYRNDEGTLCWSKTHLSNTFPAGVRRDATFGRYNRECTTYVAAARVAELLKQGIAEPLLMEFSDMESTSGSLFTHIEMAKRNNPVINELVMYRITDNPRDFDFKMHMYSAVDSGRNLDLAASDIPVLATKLGYRQGGIYVLWCRDKISINNPIGIIDTNTPRHLVRFDGFEQDSRGEYTKAVFTALPEPATLEDRFMEYRDISDEHKHLFDDLLKPPSAGYFTTIVVPLYDLAIENYITNQEYFLMKLDPSEVVDRWISDGDVHDVDSYYLVSLSINELIYWVLQEWGFEFDRDLYYSTYFDSSTPLYDLVRLQGVTINELIGG